MKTTKKYYFKYILEVGRSILQGGYREFRMFDLLIFQHYKFTNLLVIYPQDFFSGKGSVPPSVNCISMSGVQNVEEISWMEESELFLTAHLGEVPDVLSINFHGITCGCLPTTLMQPQMNEEVISRSMFVISITQK